MNKILVKNLDDTSPFWHSPAFEGAFWKIFSCAAFAGINGIVRYFSKGSVDGSIEVLPVNVMMFFQNIFGALFLLPWVFKGGITQLKTQYPTWHVLRIVTAVLGIYLWYLSLQRMPIAEGVALTFTGPIFTVIAAWFLLSEKLTLKRSIAIFLCISGAFIISRPDLAFQGDTQSVGFAVLFPLGSALVLALSKVFTRKLGNLGEKPTTLAIYLLVGMVPVSLLPAVYEWVNPKLVHWPWLIVLGFLAAAAHLSFAKAYQLAEVTFLTPFGFSKFFLSMLVGYYLFGELPTESLWIGTLVIFSGILILSYRIPLYSMAKRLRSN